MKPEITKNRSTPNAPKCAAAGRIGEPYFCSMMSGCEMTDAIGGKRAQRVNIPEDHGARPQLESGAIRPIDEEGCGDC
jgi:hypothetical protein